ncbi:MAG: CHAD domain-containing protein [Gammaproteobacteria bacterium]
MAAITPTIHHFLGTASLATLSQAARDALPDVEGRSFEHELRLLDTPDLALRRRGWLLEWRQRQGEGMGEGELCLRRHGRDSLLRGAAPTCPATVPAVDSSRLRARLAALCGADPLRTVRCWRGQGWAAPCRNQDQKIECELSAVTYPSAGAGVVLGELRAKRGYERETATWAGQLSAVLPWRTLAEDPLLVLEREVGPGQPTVPPRQSADAPARAAVAAVLQGHLGVIAQVAPPGAGAPDAEALHDLRVAARRTRSLLRGHRGLFDPRLVLHFAGEFRWLARATSRLRDLDVLLEALTAPSADFAPLAPAERVALAGVVTAERAVAAGRLARLLASSRYARLLADWAAALGLAIAEDGDGPRLLTATSRAVRRALRRLRRDAEAVEAHYTPDGLHELRKRGKRLRYLLEPFTALYPRERIGVVLADLKALQTMMGEICDRNAALELLDGPLARRARGSRPLRDALAAARAALEARITRSEVAAVVAALARFDARDHQRTLGELFEPAP